MEELYVNKNGWKCVRSQLAKTDGRDPQEHGAVIQRYMSTPVEERDASWVARKNTDLAALKVRVAEFEDTP